MKPLRNVLAIPRGYRSKEAASFVGQLDDLTAVMESDLQGITTAELEWQPRRGMNTIGMLLAHIAVVEVSWIEAAVRGVPPAAVDFVGIVGLGVDDDGIPLPSRGRHPAALRGWSLARYRSRLRVARANVKNAVRRLTDRDVDRVRRRTRRDGRTQVYNVRWVLYHLLEHLAGHYGQILLLRHAYRDRRKPR